MRARFAQCYRRLPLAQRAVIGLLGAGLVYGGAIAAIVPVFDHVALNGTASVPAHLLWKTPHQPIARGDLVLAPANDPMIPESYSHLTKFALCLEGDLLTERDGAFWCNGELLNRVKARTRTGAPLKPFAWKGGRVPKGRMFIGSRHPDGYDSRYLGFFDTRDLVRLEKVL